MQFEQLKKIIGWAYDKSLFYRQSFDKAGVNPNDLQTLDDIKKFPFLTLDELNKENSMDFLTLPLSNIVRINHVEDAGIDVTNFYTRDDIIKNVEIMISCLRAAKIYRGSIVGIQGDISDGKILDVIYALESMSATVVPFSKNFIEILDNFGIETLVTTQKNFESLLNQLQAAGKNISDYPLRKIIFLNKNIFPNRTELKNISVYDLFAPPEIGIAGLIFQCNQNFGCHIQEDNFFFEVANFSSDKIFNNEHMGELVITTLTAQARPLIRYRTRQAVYKNFLYKEGFF
mgnify:CR=1 FL=1